MHQVIYTDRCVPMIGKVTSHKPHSLPQPNDGDIIINTPPFKKKQPFIKVFPKKLLWHTIPKVSSVAPKSPQKQHTHHPFPIKGKDFEREYSEVWPTYQWAQIPQPGLEKQHHWRSPTHCTSIGELVHGVHTSKACHGGTMELGETRQLFHISQMLNVWPIYLHLG